jgi:hypothetical protein
MLFLWGTGSIERDAANPKRFGTEKLSSYSVQASLSKSGNGIAEILQAAFLPTSKSWLISIELL